MGDRVIVHIIGLAVVSRISSAEFQPQHFAGSWVTKGAATAVLACVQLLAPLRVSLLASLDL